ncbi:tripartite tricarboxylate transporter TctB family protein [Roseomonas sp. M0104]|uniref:Tripartite tricarboxylate transporter TctB family protein n=1 Tax=Teichococcus coralli TaxID=2545983 RepID=A0A845BFB4_9PROT|nr:tripartite tricarboxylate transporter TctB family protein [Pseudoroseomonas coralli]MXP64790.1 tripartite tricarboxylate transporter TctB family protein [Pseudoroseomonas coralli]
MRVNDAVLGVILLLLAGTMIWLTTYFPSFPGQDYGPALFPRLLGGGLILCALLLIRRGHAARRAGEGWVTLAPWWSQPGLVVSFLAMPLAVLAYLFFADALGFIPLAFALLLALFLWFGERPLRALPVAAVATLLINWFFSDMMRVPLPRGLLTGIL